MSRFYVCIISLLVVCFLVQNYFLRSYRAEARELGGAIERLEVAYAYEQERAYRLEQSAGRLLEQEREQTQWLLELNERYDELAKQNEDHGRILSIVIPPELLDGLRAFSAD